MSDPLDPYLDWLRAAGAGVHRSPGARELPPFEGPLVDGAGTRREIHIPGLPPIVEHRNPEADLAADHASLALAQCLTRPEVMITGRRVWDIGCGTGVLPVAAARLGAREVVGTDIDPEAIRLSRQTLATAGLEAELHECSLLDALGPERRADLLVINLPHKPTCAGLDLPAWSAGGPEGCSLHEAMAPQAAKHVDPGGQLIMFLHSLPHPRLLACYGEAFTFELLCWKRRFLTGEEPAALRQLLEQRNERGESFLGGEADRRFFVAGLWLGTRR